MQGVERVGARGGRCCAAAWPAARAPSAATRGAPHLGQGLWRCPSKLARYGGCSKSTSCLGTPRSSECRSSAAAHEGGKCLAAACGRQVSGLRQLAPGWARPPANSLACSELADPCDSPRAPITGAAAPWAAAPRGLSPSHPPACFGLPDSRVFAALRLQASARAGGGTARGSASLGPPR